MGLRPHECNFKHKHMRVCQTCMDTTCRVLRALSATQKAQLWSNMHSHKSQPLYNLYIIHTVTSVFSQKPKEFKDVSSPPPHAEAYLRCRVSQHQNRPTTYDSTNLFGGASLPTARLLIFSIFFLPSSTPPVFQVETDDSVSR